jgi:hypothetical protein
MSNSKLFGGSICLTDLIDAAKRQHSSFTKSQKNGKVYANILLWENGKPDEYGNTHSIQLNSTKEKKDVEAKVYFGRAKPLEIKEPQPISESDAISISNDLENLPF